MPYRSRGDSPSSPQLPVSGLQAASALPGASLRRSFSRQGFRLVSLQERYGSNPPVAPVTYNISQLFGNFGNLMPYRSRGDSNPRYPFGAQLLSREPDSAALAPLQGLFLIRSRGDSPSSPQLPVSGLQTASALPGAPAPNFFTDKAFALCFYRSATVRIPLNGVGVLHSKTL